MGGSAAQVRRDTARGVARAASASHGPNLCLGVEHLGAVGGRSACRAPCCAVLAEHPIHAGGVHGPLHQRRRRVRNRDSAHSAAGSSLDSLLTTDRRSLAVQEPPQRDPLLAAPVNRSTPRGVAEHEAWRP
eukprot:Amastigsp_a1519_367.p3 type:complete len:131 gc:universal Amastigsp_a1519_367:1285-893(-)